jgi:tetratricopeptide (TPR) repeat protein
MRQFAGRHSILDSAIAIATACVIALVAARPALARDSGSSHTTRASAGARAASAALVDEAEQLVKEAGQSDPLDSEKVRTAVAKLKHAIELDSRNDSAWVDLGFCYGLLKDPGDAVDAYRTAAKINPSPANFKELTDIYLRVGNPELALMAANAGLLKDRRNASLYNARGMALTDLQRFDEAARDFRKALALDPSLAAAKVNLDALGDESSGRATITKRKRLRKPIGGPEATDPQAESR